MNAFMTSPLVQALGWTLVHALWQGLLLALLLRGLLVGLPQQAARLRYALASSTLLILLLGAGLTCWSVYDPADPQVASMVSVAGETSVSDPAVLFSPTEPTKDLSMLVLENWTEHLLSPALPWLVGAWLLGLVLLGLRFAGSLFYLHRLPRRYAWAADHLWQAQLEKLKERLAVRRRVQLLISSRISEPMMLGILKPVILLPVGLLTQLPPDQVEAILLHELAHIRRADYLINLLQSLVEILFFFHPACWWISKQVRKERELCCDDLVMRGYRNPMGYAQALIAVQRFSQSQQTKLAMSFTGNTSQFSHRIHRLFESGGEKKPASLAMLSTIILLCLAVLAFRPAPLQTTSLQMLPVVQQVPSDKSLEVTFYRLMPEAEVNAQLVKMFEKGIEISLDVLKFDEQKRLIGIAGRVDASDHRASFQADPIERLNLRFAWGKEGSCWEGIEVQVSEWQQPTTEPVPSPEPPKAVSGEPILIEVKSDISRAALEKLIKKLEAQGITFSNKNINFNDGRLTEFSGTLRYRGTTSSFAATDFESLRIKIEPMGEAKVKYIRIDVNREEGKKGSAHLHIPHVEDEVEVVEGMKWEESREENEFGTVEVHGLEAEAIEIEDTEVVIGEEDIPTGLVPGAEGDKKVRVEADSIEMIGLRFMGEPAEAIIHGPVEFKITDPEKTPQVLLVTPGKQHFISWEDFEQLLESLPKEAIRQVAILTPEAARERYGEKAGGKQLIRVELKQEVFSAADPSQGKGLHPAPTGPQAEALAPGDAVFRDLQVYPNPFSQEVKVAFWLEEAAEVSIKVLDAQGREVALLKEGKLPSGAHSLRWNREQQADGPYFVHLQKGKQSITRRILAVGER
jgi:beta-lactamase regulating signal transducer with metallopeptidase domain